MNGVRMAEDRRTGGDRRLAITVVLVDDEPLIRSALAQTLSPTGLDLVGEASSGHEAIELVVDLRPDIVLMDVRLPGLTGVETIEQLGLLAPASRILVLTRPEENLVVEAIIAGASGYILKTAPPQDIIDAVRATAAGESVLSPEIAGKLVQHIRSRHIPVVTSSPHNASTIRATLTARELDIFTLIASGQSNQQIGDALSLSSHTVSNHIKSILAKLHLDNRIQAAAEAVRSGIS
jgi:two-component system, NarL family, nitrate/nitrite response regulator NarL